MTRAGHTSTLARAGNSTLSSRAGKRQPTTWPVTMAKRIPQLSRGSNHSAVIAAKASNRRSSEQQTSTLDDRLHFQLSKRQAVAKADTAPLTTSHASWLEQLQSELPAVLSVVSLVSPFFFWGTSMVVMKNVLSDTSPLFLACLRLLPAGLALIAWATWSGRKQPSTLTAWTWVVLFALVDAAAFQGFLAEGLQRTSAGLGSVIIDSQPLTVAVLAALLFGERLGPAAIGGLLLGLLGLGLLEVPPELVAPYLPMLPDTAGSMPADAAAEDLVRNLSVEGLWENGEWWMLLAAQAMALGTVMIRWVTPHVDPIMATGWHMLIGGFMLLGFHCLQDPAALLQDAASLTWSDGAAMAYVSLLGGAASYGLFFYNASRGSLTALSSLTFLTPVFAAGAGYLALHETLTPLQLTGAAVTLSAVSLINKRPAEADNS